MTTLIILAIIAIAINPRLGVGLAIFGVLYWMA